MDDKEYEAAVAALYEVLGESLNPKIEYGANCRRKGKSGSSYQIDVLIETSNGLQTMRTAVECKHWQKKVDRKIVGYLIAILKDTDIEKGVIVSKEGFTRGATALAKENNISLMEMREPRESDWEGVIREITLTLNCSVPEPYEFEVMQPVRDRKKLAVSLNVTEATVEEPGESPADLMQILTNELNSEPREDRTAEIIFAEGTLIEVAGFDRKIEMEGIRFKIKYHRWTEETTVKADETIRMIVRDVFEGRRFNIGYDGQVTEVQ